MALTIARGETAQITPTGESIQLISTTLAANSGTLTPSMTGLVLSGESISQQDALVFNRALDALEPVIEALTARLPTYQLADIATTTARQNAAAYGAMLAMDPMVAANRELVVPSSKNALHRVIESDGFGINNLAKECIDGACGDTMVTNTLLFNLNVCGGGTGLIGNLYPMMVLDPAQAGFRVIANLVYVNHGITHEASGALAAYKRTNLIKAYADHTVLESGNIMVIPVWTTANKALFVDDVLVPPVDRERDGEAFKTSYIKDGVELNLLGISQTPNSVSRGLADATYSLQRDVSVSDVLVQVGADLINLKLSGIMSTRFSNAAQGDGTGLVLTLGTTSVAIDANTKTLAGIAPASASIVALAAAGAVASLCLEASGRVDIQTGRFRVVGTQLVVDKVVDSTGVEIPLASAPAAAFVTAMATATFLGWNIRALMCPENLSVDCLQVNQDCYIEEHFVPYVCTISTRRVVNRANPSDVDNLLQLARVRMENNAATHLLDSVDQLEELYRAARLQERPDVLGLGRLFVRPTFLKKTLDMSTVSTMRAGERREDIRAMLNDAIAEITSRLYTTSDLQAARCYLRPNDNEKPTVNIITSTHIATYIATTGQFASMSDMFNVKVIVSPDRRFDDQDVGKIIVTFSNYNDSRNVEFDPLSWGVAAYSPEVVYNINRGTGKSYVNEIIVSPRYKLINGLPVAGTLIVTNLSRAAINSAQPW